MSVLKDLHKKKGIDAVLDRIEAAFYNVAEAMAAPNFNLPVKLKINDAVDRLQFIRILTNAGYIVSLQEQETPIKGKLDYFVVVYLKESEK